MTDFRSDLQTENEAWEHMNGLKDARILALEAENDSLKEILKKTTGELEDAINELYLLYSLESLQYLDKVQNKENDMETVLEARAALQEKN